MVWQDLDADMDCVGVGKLLPVAHKSYSPTVFCKHTAMFVHSRVVCGSYIGCVTHTA